MQRESVRAACARFTLRRTPLSSAGSGSATDRLSSAARLSASTLVATSTSKACWLEAADAFQAQPVLQALNPDISRSLTAANSSRLVDRCGMD